MKLIFKCTSCGALLSKPKLICPYCSGIVLAEYEREKVKLVLEKPGHWMYRDLLQLLDFKISLGEGNTPLVESTRIARKQEVYFKDESRNPTGSIRDRAAALVVNHAIKEGYKRIVLASDGNMGVSVAAYAAKAGLNTNVYVPSWVETEKIFLMKAYDAKIIAQDKSIDVLLKEVDEYCDNYGLYNASSTYNTLALEGLKTLAYETYMQLKKTPKNIYIPLGSGISYLALYHGFRELLDLGVTNTMPRLIGVEHCGNPNYSMYWGKESKCREETFPGLRYSKPVIFEHVVEAISKVGDVITVTSKETIKAAKLLAKKEGLLTELSSAVAVAGFLKNKQEDSVIILFGYGLKSASSYTRPKRRKFTEPYIGITKKLIINTVASKPGLTGYEIWKELGLNLSPQAVYQHLRDLVAKGYIKQVESNGVKKYYSQR